MSSEHSLEKEHHCYNNNLNNNNKIYCSDSVNDSFSGASMSQNSMRICISLQSSSQLFTIALWNPPPPINWNLLLSHSSSSHPDTLGQLPNHLVSLCPFQYRCLSFVLLIWTALFTLLVKCTGNPQVFPRVPVPVPEKTHTRNWGYRFWGRSAFHHPGVNPYLYPWVWVWVLPTTDHQQLTLWLSTHVN